MLARMDEDFLPLLAVTFPASPDCGEVLFPSPFFSSAFSEALALSRSRFAVSTASSASPWTWHWAPSHWQHGLPPYMNQEMLGGDVHFIFLISLPPGRVSFKGVGWCFCLQCLLDRVHLRDVASRIMLSPKVMLALHFLQSFRYCLGEQHLLEGLS